MQTETLTLNGQPFYIRRWGDPALPPVLLLHGFPEYGGAWEPLARHLEDRFHCIAPDQRGYGRSWAPEGVQNYAMSALVADMAALISHTGAPLTVIGHDWGAGVAYGLAMFRPELVARLIIANGVHPVPFQRALAAGGAQAEASQYINFLRRPDSHRILAANDFEKLLALFSAKMDLSWLSGELRAAYKAEWARDERLNTMIHWYRASPLQVPEPGQALTGLPDFPRDKLLVRCPHLLIWGQDDTALLPEATEGLEYYAPDLTRVTLPGVDHWLLHQTPAEVARLIKDWMP